jgi:hypothetical protein
MELTKLNRIQQLILVAASVILILMSFREEVRIAQILGIAISSILLTYVFGQIQIKSLKLNIKWVVIKKIAIWIFCLTLGASFFAATNEARNAYLAKAEYVKYLEEQSHKTPQQIADEKAAMEKVLEAIKPWVKP